MHRDLDRIPTSCKGTSPEKAVKNQVARQDSRHRGPEEIRGAKHAYSLKASTAKMDWPCIIRMPDARLPKKVFYEELQEGNRS